MALAIAFIVVALLLAGFLALTSFERKRGKRLFAGSRDALDARVSHANAVLSAADFGKLAYHGAHVAFDHLVHELTHAVLFVVRVIERFLTRAVRYLRDRRSNAESDPRAPLAEEVEKLKEAIRAPEREGQVE